MKVFGIGLNKTGTTTLSKCGEILGFRCKSCDRELLEDFRNNKYDRILKTVREYDFFEDWPWPLAYRTLHKAFPESKFILTVRSSPDVWFKSLCLHSLTTHPENHCRKLAYGYDYPHMYKREHINFYNNFNNSVMKYFGNSLNFITLCWENGDEWKKLCGFLGKEVPDTSFPHERKQSDVRQSEYFKENSLNILNEIVKK